MGNILITLILIAVNAFLIFLPAEPSARPLMFKIYGIAVPVIFLLAVICMVVFKWFGAKPGEAFKTTFFNVVMCLLVVVITNLAALFAGYLVDRLIQFHMDNNAGNIKTFPVHFAIRNRQAIIIAFKSLFLFGSALAFYGLWIAER